MKLCVFTDIFVDYAKVFLEFLVLKLFPLDGQRTRIEALPAKHSTTKNVQPALTHGGHVDSIQELPLEKCHSESMLRL